LLDKNISSGDNAISQLSKIAEDAKIARDSFISSIDKS
jgi:hypothetical protein